MGVSRTPEELAAKVIGYGRGIGKANQRTVETAALTVKTRVLAEAAKPLGADLSFTGSGTQKPKRVGVRYKVNKDRAEIKATGPMHWLESGIKPHAIAPKGAGGSRRARTDFVSQAFGSGPISFGRGRIGVLRFADGSFRPYARRAGKFPAQRTWSDGVKGAELIVKKTFRQIHVQELTKEFR